MIDPTFYQKLFSPEHMLCGILAGLGMGLLLSALMAMAREQWQQIADADEERAQWLKESR